MIIPTPEFDPMYASDGIPFRAKMIGYIEREFGDLLRGRERMLHSDLGLAMLAQITASQPHGAGTREAA